MTVWAASASSASSGGEGVGAGRQARASSAAKPADAFAVHGELGGARRRDHRWPGLQPRWRPARRWRWPRSRAHEVRALPLDQRAQGLGVRHGDDVGPMCHLLARGVGVAVDGNHLYLRRCSEMMTSLPSSPLPSSITRGSPKGTVGCRFASLRQYFRWPEPGKSLRPSFADSG